MMKTRIVLLLSAVSVCVMLRSEDDLLSLGKLDSLDAYLERRAEYDMRKELKMDSLKRTAMTQYQLYELLTEEYASYEFDSALLYVNKLIDEAVRSADANKITRAYVKKSFVYLSAGLFKESADLLESINVTSSDVSTRIMYYTTYARLLYDLADYNHSELYHSYVVKGNTLTDSALMFLSPLDTSRYWYAEAVRDMKTENYSRALERFRFQLLASDITEHEKAITYSSMGYIYHVLGMSEESLCYNTLAAISDIRNSTKEAVALRNVALHVFRDGDTQTAMRYIRYALDDAQFYNARHRQLEISQILPIIESSFMEQQEEQNKSMTRQTVVTYVLILVLLIAIVVIVNRVRAARSASLTIEKINLRLREANKIREEYISTLLCAQTESINKLEQYQRWVKKRAQERRTDELQTVPTGFNVTKSRTEFYKQFDEMFLQVFPDFVSCFNALLRPDEQIIPDKRELLNTDLRIFALIRLGVTDNEKIAQVLDYSVNTIYTYKTRVKNRSDLPTEEFNRRVMSIPAIS